MIICQYLIFNHNSFVWRAQNQRFSNVSAAWNSLISSLFPLICNFSNVKRGINNMQPTVSLWQGVRMVSHRELLSARRLPVWEKIYLINDHRHNLRNAMKNFLFYFLFTHETLLSFQTSKSSQRFLNIFYEVWKNKTDKNFRGNFKRVIGFLPRCNPWNVMVPSCMYCFLDKITSSWCQPKKVSKPENSLSVIRIQKTLGNRVFVLFRNLKWVSQRGIRTNTSYQQL